jgi:3D (Asp-Asp-Asp) domain-containing protein
MSALPSREQHSKHAPRTFRATAYALKGRTRSGAQTKQAFLLPTRACFRSAPSCKSIAGQYSGVYTVHDTGGKIKRRRKEGKAKRRRPR